jgi:hypothetical protein
MDRPTRRRRYGIQSASLVFVCTLVVGVAAIGLLELNQPAPSATEITPDNQAYGSGPFSTFPASWDDFCGYPVQGNKTTSLDLSNPQIANSTLSQIYSKIVDSSAFRAFANGSSWVTVYWSSFQESNRTGFYDVVAGDFVFVSGGSPDGSAQFDYFLEGGQVTFGYGPLQSTCVNTINASYSASLIGSNGSALPGWTGGSFPIGQPVKLNFTVEDETIANMTVTSHTSCLGNFMIFFGSGRNATTIYDSTRHPGCSGAPLSVVLNPDEKYTQTVEWNQTDDAGAQVPPGNYWMTASMVGSPFIQVGKVSVDAP